MSFRNRNDPISTRCEFELNLIENEHYSHKDFNQIPNLKTNDQIEIANLTCAPQNDGA